MKKGEGALLVENGNLVDGTGAKAVPAGAVLIQDGKIAYVGPKQGAPALPPGGKRIDAQGGTILPGLVEPHFHATYFNVQELADLDIKYPAEYVTLIAAANSKLLVECGYTSARSCGSLHNIDVWLRKAIESGMHVGPRLATSGREICGAGGLMDWNPDYWQLQMDGLVMTVNGPVEARAAVRRLVKDGVEWVKTYPTGDAASPSADHHVMCMTKEEIEACASEAHNYRKKITGHTRSREGIKIVLRAGFDCMEHATFIDEEGLDLLLQRNVPVVPALRFEQASVERGKEYKLPQWCIDGHKECMEAGAESARKIFKAGGRIGLGGDFGFAWNPHGEYAKEITFYVDYVGFTPLEALMCATKTGAEIMGREKEFGTLEAGKLGDVLVVGGDVLKNIRLLEDRTKFIAVVQGGIVRAGQMAGKL